MKSFYFVRHSACLLSLACLTWASPAWSLDKVVMRINFSAWGMHAQYYGGKAQGFYEKEGIDLEIRPRLRDNKTKSSLERGKSNLVLAMWTLLSRPRPAGCPLCLS